MKSLNTIGITLVFLVVLFATILLSEHDNNSDQRLSALETWQTQHDSPHEETHFESNTNEGDTCSISSLSSMPLIVYYEVCNECGKIIRSLSYDEYLDIHRAQEVEAAKAVIEQAGHEIYELKIETRDTIASIPNFTLTIPSKPGKDRIRKKYFYIFYGREPKPQFGGEDQDDIIYYYGGDTIVGMTE